MFYYLFFRRIFLWYRTNWLRQENKHPRQEDKADPPSLYVAEFKKIVPLRNKSSLAQNPPIQTISTPALEKPLTLRQGVRRGSLNLPSHLQARLNKY